MAVLSFQISDLGSEIKDLELLGTLCDKIKQQKYKSSYGLYIQFQSDASIMGTGFNVTYYQAYSRYHIKLTSFLYYVGPIASKPDNVVCANKGNTSLCIYAA